MNPDTNTFTPYIETTIIPRIEEGQISEEITPFPITIEYGQTKTDLLSTVVEFTSGILKGGKILFNPYNEGLNTKLNAQYYEGPGARVRHWNTTVEPDNFIWDMEGEHYEEFEESNNTENSTQIAIEGEDDDENKIKPPKIKTILFKFVGSQVVGANNNIQEKQTELIEA